MRQADLADRAGVSRYKVGRLERASLAGLSIAAVERIAGALDATVHLELRWRGEQLDRLMDAAHAELQQQVAALLAAAGLWWERVTDGHSMPAMRRQRVRAVSGGHQD